jgi:Tfp pilus assembly protein PilF
VPATTQLTLFMLHAHTPYVPDFKARGTALLRLYDMAEKLRKTPNPVFERYCAIALRQYHQRHYADAEDTMLKVAREGRGNYFFHFILACNHLESGNSPAALVELTSALELEPVSSEARFLRAVVRAGRDDLAGALQDAERAVEAAPGNYMTYLLRASILEGLAERPPALQDLDKAAGLAPHLRDLILRERQKLAEEQ